MSYVGCNNIPDGYNYLNHMKNSAIHILRVGLGITFLWIAVLILYQPEGWGRLIQPWALSLLPVSLKTAMIQTAILDILVGFFLLIDRFTLIAAGLAFLHLITVITTVGINAGTVRDIGLAASALALVPYYWPVGKPKISDVLNPHT